MFLGSTGSKIRLGHKYWPPGTGSMFRSSALENFTFSPSINKLHCSGKIILAKFSLSREGSRRFSYSPQINPKNISCSLVPKTPGRNSFALSHSSAFTKRTTADFMFTRYTCEN